MPLFFFYPPTFIVSPTSAAMGIGSLLPLVAFMLSGKADAVPAMLVTLLIFFTSLIWYFMAGRWWAIQNATFLRMRHIEPLLDVYQTRYIYYLDRKINLEAAGPTLTPENFEELQQVRNSKFYLRGVRKWLRLAPIFVLLSWGEYSFYLFFKTTIDSTHWGLLLFVVPYPVAMIVNIAYTKCTVKG